VDSEVAKARALFNDPYYHNYRKLSENEVAQRLNHCRVGLCLSAVEGINYASVQSLRCGLPIVPV
jgi:hypothetical protein